MKTAPSLITAVLFAACHFTFFACSSDDPSPPADTETSSASEGAVLCSGDEYDPNIYRCESGELIGKCKGTDFYPAYQICEDGIIKNKSSGSFNTGALRAQPVAATNNINEPKVLTSWRKGDVNYYVIDVGHIDYSLLMESEHIRYLGFGSVTVEMRETVEQSMSKSRTATVSNSITFFESNTENKNINDVFDLKFGGKVGWGPFSVEGSVQKTITSNYETSVTVETTQGRTTETSEAIVQELKVATTNALSYTIDRTDPGGYYRYAWYATSDVYFIILTSFDNQELLSWHTISSPRAIGTQGIEYSETDYFDNSPVNGSEIVFTEDFYKRLPPPPFSEFSDTRDNKKYKFVEIGTQIWMAENLNWE